jgi:septal ring factor EnvC (AmiA/AmiB activator)
LDRLRERMGRGSPNTIQPLLDQWWKTLAARLDAGPAALHRIPESVAHIVEALWLQTVAEARIRAQQELANSAESQVAARQQLEVRSYVLSLREGELVERVRSRDEEIARLRSDVASLKTLIARLQIERDTRSAAQRKPKSIRRRRGTTPEKTKKVRRPSTPKQRKGRRRVSRAIPPKRPSRPAQTSSTHHPPGRRRPRP